MRDVQPRRHQEVGMADPVGQGGPDPDGWARDWAAPGRSSGFQDKPELQRKDSHPTALG